MPLLLRSVLLLIVFGLCGCSSSERTTQSTEEKGDSLQPATAETSVGPSEAEGKVAHSDAIVAQISKLKTAPIEKQRADVFARFLKDDLNKHEIFLLKESCEVAESPNPFCYSINNREKLVADAKALKLKRGYRARFRPIRPKFKNDEVQNWRDLRQAGINSLIRGLRSVNAPRMNILKELTLSEKECPNNMGAAMAATLEDDLPDGIKAEELGSLYEKTGECNESQGQDKETLITRAGLFYYLGKQYAKASELFTKATQVQDAYTGRAMYWLFRSQSNLSLKDKASETLEGMKSKYPFSFHTLVAITTGNKDPGDILSKSLALKRKRSDQSTVVNNLIEQVELLRRSGYEGAASEVLDWAIGQSPEIEPEVKIYLAELKDDEGDHLSNITILSDVLYRNPTLVSKETMELYFPKVFFPIFEKNAAGLDPYLLLAVARQESAFNPKAVSRADARGLLQVLPRTGRRFNQNKTPNLMDPESNVRIGAKYLLDLLMRTNGQVHFALAAYNAGEARLNTWTERYPTSEPVLFIDLLPYRETREYISSILRNYYWYRRIHQAEAHLLAKRLFDAQITSQDQ